ncbi:glyoxalase [Sporosarcina sp. NCCP-2716]|uniref:VOC family protein n=1 Tax=Sporosarcina sp. NCCP-2716 TaxID=2943679 RepID=UPI0020402ECE|nr:VOC family protein [Sporosarcina sp. NCCP-2716]GKV69734.1 glyoxalase [Sporosarcina sp. NCCP-2716]
MHFHQAPITFVSHVALKVTDMQRSLEFYQHVLGFQVASQSPKKASLTADGKNVLLTLEQPENVSPKQTGTTGLYHFALLLPTRSDLAAVVRHLDSLGIQFGAADHLVSEAIYISDPEGNGIELYIDRDPSVWEWNNGEVVMTTDPLQFASLLAEPKHSWNGLPAATLMGHIHLHVSDLAQAEHFYCQGLGFNVVSRLGSQALFLSDGHYHHHIAVNTWTGIGAPAPSASSAGLQSYSICYPDEAARERVIRQLETIGVPISKKNDSYVTEDPSGNCIEVVVG